MSELVTLVPAKHMGFLEQNQRFAELVGDFATTVIERASPLDVRAVER